ncbi:MAG: TonB-dependent receptor [Bryobacterales bacterium]|nr:TonB-dependent receptor [Bryobacterales bacterium]
MRSLETVVIALLLCAALLPAQVSTGTIGVIAQDSTGAVIPGSAVTVTNRNTGLTRNGSTDAQGEFSAPFLPAGEYSITVEVRGFKRATVAQFTLQVDQSATVRVTLTPGDVVETVEVREATPLLEADTSSLGQVIENRKILELPLNGRNPFALGLLAGNTTPMFGMGTNLPFIAGGGRFSSNEVLLDGLDNNTGVTAGAIGRNGVAMQPSVDAVQEFKVKTNSFSAEFGHAAGAVVSATIKSGSNNYHGTLFEFLRNDRLDANNFFTNAAGLPKAKFRQNQYGGALGGRILRDKTFFFTDYQGTRQRTAASSSIGSLPPKAIRDGDLSLLRTPIFDPLARRIGPNGTVVSTLFPGARIPASQLNPTSLAITKLIPDPNFGDPNSLSRNFFRQVPRGFDADQFDVRIDHALSSKNNLFGRFSLSNQTNPNPGSFDGFIGGSNTQYRNIRQAVMNDTHVFSPTVVNEFRAGYTRHNGSRIVDDVNGGVKFALANNLAMFPFPVKGFPSIAFNFSGEGTGSTQFDGWGGGASDLNYENRFQVADTLLITRGKHTFKTGADIRRPRFENLRGNPFFGQFIFGSILSSSSDTPGSGAPFADFLMGFPSLVQGTQMLDWGRQREIYFGTFFQDDWKVTQRLTLNLGVRYDLYTQPVDARDRGGLFDLAKARFAVPGKDGYTRAIVDGDHNNLGPRAGFAYQAKRRWVLRGGYGIFFGLRDQNQEVTQIAGNNPNTPALVVPVVSASRTVAPPYTLNSPVQAGPSEATLESYSADKPITRTIRSQAFHDARYPMLHQFNFSIQFQPWEALLIETSYQGARGRDLATLFINKNQVPFEYALDGRNVQRDRPYPMVNGVVIPTYSLATSNYNAFNLRVEKRYSSGLNLLLNYTIQKNLEAGGAGPSAFTQNGGTSIALDTYNLSRERGPAPIDVPQIFSLSFGYDLPWGPGKKWLGSRSLASRLIGGWQVNGITSLRGGFPTDIRTNRLPPIFNTFNVPDRVPGQQIQVPGGERGPDRFFNAAAFRVPGTTLSKTGAVVQVFGDSARRVARGPGSVNLDFSLFKEMSLTEKHRIQFRTEFFNLTNTPTFYLPSSNSPSMTCIGRTPGSACDDNNAQFGKMSGSSATGRQIQFGLKFIF